MQEISSPGRTFLGIGAVATDAKVTIPEVFKETSEMFKRNDKAAEEDANYNTASSKRGNWWQTTRRRRARKQRRPSQRRP